MCCVIEEAREESRHALAGGSGKPLRVWICMDVDLCINKFDQPITHRCDSNSVTLDRRLQHQLPHAPCKTLRLARRAEYYCEGQS